MKREKKTFRDLEEVRTYLKDHGRSGIFLAELKLDAYLGMFVFTALFQDQDTTDYYLDVEYMSYGMEGSGENWQQSYRYKSPGLEPFFKYLYDEFGIEVADISYKVPKEDLPDYHNKSMLPDYEEAWDRFYADFQEGKLRAKGLEILFSDEGERFVKPRNPMYPRGEYP